MSSSCWPGFLGVVGGGGCVGLVDHYRLLRYVQCAANPRGFRPNCVICPELGYDSAGAPRVIGCPATDPAPWYVPSDPAWLLDVAGRFFGPEIIRWEPQPFGYVEDDNPRVGHRPRRGKLRIEATIRFWGDGCDATRYGLEWFQRAIECQVCSGLQLRVLRDCDQTFDPLDPANTGGHWWRDLFAARILVEPIVADNPGACCSYRDADLIIEASDSCEYWITPSIECVASSPWHVGGEEDQFDDCRCGPLCPCPVPVPSCVGDCLPSVTNPRDVLAPVSIGCYCVPFATCRKVCELPSSSTPGQSDAVLGITIRSIGAPTRNLRVWVWRADAGPGPDEEWDRWRCISPCTTIDVGSLLADDVLTIDGRDRSVVVTRQTETCALEVTSMGGPLFWPVLDCADRFWVAVEYDPYTTAADLVVSTAVYPRECWTA